ncbi:MAG: tRNA ((7)-)-methyltransferase [Bacteroidota bacterium]|jgi:tRNA (guanine-N7-)-methyltransferase|nr:tRNA (guanosine(46)-N7)-methyltransferase TrmB [Bacteroidota bacterium]NBX64608.1 tRNA (guanosine(46)-N7)-methyltransferase TrmB [Bacteroidota bacterium]
MSKPKLIKFAEYKNFSNTFDIEDTVNKGRWHSLFGNNNPIVIELACGKGDYTLGLARMNPNINYIGIDIKSNRMWTGAKAALDEQLTNVRFLRTHIDHITDFFAPEEVSEIWITFADPQPHKPRKRLSSYKFLNIYRKIASEHTLVNVKTDSDLFFESTLAQAQQDQLIVLSQIDNVYQLNQVPEFLKIQTYYEKMWLKMGRSIKYCQFILGNCESVPLKEDC